MLKTTLVTTLSALVFMVGVSIVDGYYTAKDKHIQDQHMVSKLATISKLSSVFPQIGKYYEVSISVSPNNNSVSLCHRPTINIDVG